MRRLMRVAAAKGIQYCTLCVSAFLATACAHSVPEAHNTLPVEMNPDHYLQPPGATLEAPPAALRKQDFCSDPANYPPRAYDIPQLSASQLMALFESPADALALVSNLKVLMDRDLLVQRAFFEDEVLLKFFGATQVSWEKTTKLPIHFTMHVAHLSGLSATLTQTTVSVSHSESCYNWRELTPGSNSWWPPETYDSANIRIDLSQADGPDVGLVKEIFGADPNEGRSFFYEEFGGGISYPAHVTYVSAEKLEKSALFDRHEVEFVPQEDGSLRPWPPADRRRVFLDAAKILYVNILQTERKH